MNTKFDNFHYLNNNKKRSRAIVMLLGYTQTRCLLYGVDVVYYILCVYVSVCIKIIIMRQQRSCTYIIR